jgi:hypothetical protein
MVVTCSPAPAPRLSKGGTAGRRYRPCARRYAPVLSMMVQRIFSAGSWKAIEAAAEAGFARLAFEPMASSDADTQCATRQTVRASAQFVRNMVASGRFVDVGHHPSPDRLLAAGARLGGATGFLRFIRHPEPTWRLPLGA